MILRVEMEDKVNWICSSCAIKGGGITPSIATYHMNICDVCNEWKCVTQLRDYSYPKVVFSCDKKKIYSELLKIQEYYEKQGDKFSSNEIRRRICLEGYIVDT